MGRWSVYARCADCRSARRSVPHRSGARWRRDRRSTSATGELCRSGGGCRWAATRNSNRWDRCRPFVVPAMIVAAMAGGWGIWSATSRTTTARTHLRDRSVVHRHPTCRPGPCGRAGPRGWADPVVDARTVRRSRRSHRAGGAAGWGVDPAEFDAAGVPVIVRWVHEINGS